MAKPRLSHCIFILGAMFITGCATQGTHYVANYDVDVDSICENNISVENKTYVLLPAKKGLDVDDLEYKLLAGYIHKGLSAQGYTAAPSAEDAKVVVLMDYGIEEPRTRNFALAAPIYRGTGGGMLAGSYTTYKRYLILRGLDASEYRKSAKVKNLWKTTITSVGRSDDLRRVFPYMIAASIPYISKDTGQKVAVTLREDDKTALMLKGEAIGRESAGASPVNK